MVGCSPKSIALEMAGGAWANYTEPVDAVLAHILHAGFSCNLDSKLLRERQGLRGKGEVREWDGRVTQVAFLAPAEEAQPAWKRRFGRNSP